MESIQDKDWHALEVKELAAAMDTDPAKGLSGEEASRRTERFGPNELTQGKGQGPIVRFLLQLNQPLVIILLVATVITLFLREYVDAAVIFGVVLGLFPGS